MNSMTSSKLNSSFKKGLLLWWPTRREIPSNPHFLFYFIFFECNSSYSTSFWKDEMKSLALVEIRSYFFSEISSKAGEYYNFLLTLGFHHTPATLENNPVIKIRPLKLDILHESFYPSRNVCFSLMIRFVEHFSLFSADDSRSF